MIKIKVEKCASKGIAIGEAFIVKKAELLADNYKVSEEQREEEVAKYGNAVNTVKKELEEAAKASEIFAAHMELVQDISLANSVKDSIRNDKKNVQQAVVYACDTYIAIFESMEDEYMRERSTDMLDIKERLLYALKGVSGDAFAHMTKPCVIVATDLTPSDTIRMDTDKVLGFVMQYGGVTSHVSIIAKNLGIPALVGVHNIIDTVNEGEEVILDATGKQIILSPDEQTIEYYKKEIEIIKEEKALLNQYIGVPAVTKDGKHIEVCANVGNVEDIIRAKEYGFDGIGLFRSEFLYMENTKFPTEEEQFQIYKEAALISEKEVTVRTLDIGGDKGLPYFEFEPEENPFLGWRAIRICLERKDIFKTQLRALLRASVYGKIRIMYPMIVCEEELDQANQVLLDCKIELSEEGHAYDDTIKVGIMIETPSAVFCAKELAKKSDFFSIGTNDLTQYIMAADRGNKKVEHLYNTKSISVLRAIKQVIDAGHEAGIPVGMCGEFASDESVTKLLLGMGLDEFSMSASCINKIKSIIIETDCNIQRHSHAVKSI
jgi:phosphoenolpyruvate-protein phosphotransferase